MIPWIEGPPDELLPGQLLEMDDGAVILVGHINNLRGVCDHCTAGAGLKKSILRHQVIWSGALVEF